MKKKLAGPSNQDFQKKLELLNGELSSSLKDPELVKTLLPLAARIEVSCDVLKKQIASQNLGLKRDTIVDLFGRATAASALFSEIIAERVSGEIADKTLLDRRIHALSNTERTVREAMTGYLMAEGYSFEWLP